MRILSRIAVCLLCFGELAFAEQFSRLYETSALCVTIADQEYCYVKESGAIGVLNYKGIDGDILIMAAKTSKYALVGDLASNENQHGLVIRTGQYVDTESGKHLVISISDPNLWIFHDDCVIAKLWTGTKASFAKTYEFIEVSHDELRQKVTECAASESK